MNTGKVLNTSIATVFFILFLTVTLPVFNNPDMSAFQAFVLTPILMMLAGLGALGLFHGLDRANTRLRDACHSPSRPSTRGDHTGSGKRFPAHDRGKRSGNNPVHNTGDGRWAA